jgi:hypothetical protein
MECDDFFDEAMEKFSQKLKQRLIKNGKVDLKATWNFLDDLNKCLLIKDEFKRKIAILKCYEKHSEP